MINQTSEVQMKEWNDVVAENDDSSIHELHFSSLPSLPMIRIGYLSIYPYIFYFFFCETVVRSVPNTKYSDRMKPRWLFQQNVDKDADGNRRLFRSEHYFTIHIPLLKSAPVEDFWCETAKLRGSIVLHSTSFGLATLPLLYFYLPHHHKIHNTRPPYATCVSERNKSIIVLW